MQAANDDLLEKQAVPKKRDGFWMSNAYTPPEILKMV
jgi:hypothetical protein